jgi:glycosyltransferase involved in cell wall biosynthesis
MRQEQYLKGECPDDALYAFNALKRRGFDTVLCDAGHEIKGIGRFFKFLDDQMSDHGRRTGFHLWQALRLRDQMRKADLVFATADSSGLPVCLLKKLKMMKTPVICQTIGLAQSFAHGGIRFRFYRSLLGKAQAVIHFSRAEEKFLQNNFRTLADKIHFIPFGVDHKFYETKSGAACGGVAFGLDPLRDWKLLAEALSGSGIRILVHTHRDSIRNLDLPPEFVCRQPVSPNEFARIAAEASFVVLPVIENNYTGATITLLSCMAAGKAVIVSRTAAIAEGYGLVDGENCLLVAPGDVTALRRAIQKLSEDKGLCRDIGRRAARHVQNGFTLERMADDLAEIFRKVLS